MGRMAKSVRQARSRPKSMGQLVAGVRDACWWLRPSSTKGEGLRTVLRSVILVPPRRDGWSEHAIICSVSDRQFGTCQTQSSATPFSKTITGKCPKCIVLAINFHNTSNCSRTIPNWDQCCCFYLDYCSCRFHHVAITNKEWLMDQLWAGINSATSTVFNDHSVQNLASCMIYGQVGSICSNLTAA